MQKHLFTLLLLFPLIESRAETPTEVRDTINTNREITIEQVVISAEQSPLRHSMPVATISVIESDEIEHSTTTSLLPLLVERVPSLFVTSRSTMGYGISTGAAGAMSMRGIGGTPTSAMLVVVDGMPRQMSLMGHPIADGALSMGVERVEVVRGASSMLYGSAAMGGLINITTRSLDSDGIESRLRADYGSYNTLHSAITSQARKGRLFASVGGSYDRTDSHRKDMEFESGAANLKLGAELSHAWSIIADGDFLHFDSSNPGTLQSPLLDNDARVNRFGTSLCLRNNYEESSGSLRLLYNRGNHHINDGYSPDEEPLDERFRSEDFTLGVSFNEEFTTWRNAHLAIGADYRLYGGKALNYNIVSGEKSPLVDKRMQQMAGYVSLKQHIGKKLLLHAGIRYDHLLDKGGEWVPQFGIQWQVARHTRLNASVGKGFRYPTIREMYMFPPQNPDLRAESLINYSLSASHSTSDNRLMLSIELYYIDGKNTIRLESIDGRMKYLNSGRIENYGAECDITWRISQTLSLTTNYSFLHMRYKVTASPEHKLFCGIDFAKKRWRASTNVQYIRGLYTSLSPLSREEFILWNASLAFRAAKWIELNVRAENLLSQEYEIQAGYPMPRATFSGGVTLNF